MATEMGATAQNPTLSTALPTEIVTSIFSSLDKAEIKKLRLVCRYFNEVSLPLLFDRVIISSHEQDFSPFQNIVSNPGLIVHVKELTYDLQWFDDLNVARYILDLFTQLRGDIALRISDSNGNPEGVPITKPLSEILKARNHFNDPGTTHAREKLLRPWIQYVQEGFWAYRRQWNAQNKIVYGKTFPYLERALRMCPAIQHVNVRASWEFQYQPLNDYLESLLPQYPSSGFLARHWHPLYLRPKSPDQLPDLYLSPKRLRLVEDVFSAIERSGSKLSRFSLGNGCTIRPNMREGPRSVCEHMQLVFRNLTRLSLDIAADTPPMSSYIWDYLSPALSTAQSLKHLTFRVRNHSRWRHKDGIRWWLYDDLINCTFPGLEYLHLSGVVSSAEFFLSFFRKQPLLQSLHLDSIDLCQEAVDEDWSYFLEGLRQLPLVDFSVGWPLKIQNVANAGFDNSTYVCTPDQWLKTKDMIESYVLRNGTNPFPIGYSGYL